MKKMIFALTLFGSASNCFAATSNCMIIASNTIYEICDGKQIKTVDVGEFPDLYIQTSTLIKELQAQGYSVVSESTVKEGELLWTLQK
ncbi:MAG: hypothetical protein ACXVB9_00530 [Bdellovibrionota bacterium]